MAVRNERQGPSALEILVGGDTYKGVYVPPLMAEVMKEMQAEEARSKQPPPALNNDAYVGPKSRRELSTATVERLEAIANASSLEGAVDQMKQMPELVTALQGKGVVEIAAFEVADRDSKAKQAAFGVMIDGNSNSARYFGSDLFLFASASGDKLDVTSRLDKLFGYSDFYANRFGIQYDRSEEALRTGFGKYLPFSSGPDELAKFVPSFTAQELSARLRDFLETTAG